MTTAQDIEALNKVVGKMADKKNGIAAVSSRNSVAAPQPTR
jgi:hypothetical protein